jgi:nifR3 family TIM-barrel protein
MNIGSLHLENPVFFAPMAGITDLPFRTIVRGFGCSLAFTEMVSARGLLDGMGKTCRYLDSSPADRPLGVQLFGADPATLAEAVRAVAETGADLIDLNMGCPVKKVLKTGAGAALMRDPGRAAAVLTAMRKATDLPLTVKIRAGWNSREINAVEIGRIAAGCGADAVILHPRTADQGFAGLSDWGLIGALKSALPIPVIGSGDLRRPADAARLLGETGCDAVMVGRGGLGNPWLVRNTLRHLAGAEPTEPPLAEREAVIGRHLALAVAYDGETVGPRDFRKHLLWYTKGLRGGAQFRQAVTRLEGREAVWLALEAYFRDLAGAAEGESV